MQLEEIHKMRVLLRADLYNAHRNPYKIHQILPTILTLLQQGCGVCVMSAMGVAFMPDPDASTAKLVYHKLAEILPNDIQWIDEYKDADVLLGQVYFVENPYCDDRDREYSEVFQSEMLAQFDVIVHDTLNHLDKEFVSSLGMLTSKKPQALGRYLEGLESCIQITRQSKAGLIVGGSQVAWQLRLIRHLVPHLSFLAVGGELALVMMGKGQEMPGCLHDDLFMTLQALRAEKVKVLYPVDVVAYSSETQRNRICLYQDLEPVESVKDLATQSRARILSQIQKDQVDLVVLSGTIGNHLDPRYSRGTDILVQELARLSHKKVLIGKDVALAANRLSVLGGYQHVLEGNSVEIDYLSSGNPSILSWLSKEGIGVDGYL
jgi:3-phosphoglycerate kinase